jgi:hypothetical protein
VSAITSSTRQRQGHAGRAWSSSAAALAVLLLVAVTTACDSSAGHNDTKRMPKPPPPEDAATPSALHIAVEIDGREAPPIDASRLDATPPDFADHERRAWRIETLLGDAARREGAVVSVTGEKGLTIQLARSSAEGAPIAVLAVSRRGEVVAAMVDADDPFPAYHGHGGRLGRRGDPLPRIAGVTKIVARVEPKR